MFTCAPAKRVLFRAVSVVCLQYFSRSVYVCVCVSVRTQKLKKMPIEN